MTSFIEKARKIHRNQKGFTLIELLVVLVILAILVGLIVPNLFGITDGAEAVQIQGQHEKMREAVFLYHEDTGKWPIEWSGSTADIHTQLWVKGGVTGWDGPYLDRPIFQENRWGGVWGVHEGRRLDLTSLDNSQPDDPFFTALLHANVPLEVAEALDEAMDDGVRYTGAVQFGGVSWVGNRSNGGGPVDDDNFLEIIIAKE